MPGVLSFLLNIAWKNNPIQTGRKVRQTKFRKNRGSQWSFEIQAVPSESISYWCVVNTRGVLGLFRSVQCKCELHCLTKMETDWTDWCCSRGRNMSHLEHSRAEQRTRDPTLRILSRYITAGLPCSWSCQWIVHRSRIARSPSRWNGFGRLLKKWPWCVFFSVGGMVITNPSSPIESKVT
jgi:hypothetical protein